MPRPIKVSVAGVGVTQMVPVDTYISPFVLSIGCHFSGNGRYCVEHTYDNVFSDDFDQDIATWHTYPGYAFKNANEDRFGAYRAPVTAVRGRIKSGHGILKMTVTHGGYSGEDGKKSVPVIYESPAPTSWRRIKAFFSGLFK